MSAMSNEASLMADRPELPVDGDIEGQWAYLRKGVSKILASPDTRLSASNYMALYTAVSKLTTLGFPIYHAMVDFLTEYLQSVTKKLERHDQASLLQAYSNQWEQYHAGVKRIGPLFSFVDRNYVRRQVQEGKRFYFIRPLHLVQWRSEVWDKIAGRIIDCARRYIDASSRRPALGESVDGLVQRLAVLEIGHDDDITSQIRASLEEPFVSEIKEYERWAIKYSNAHEIQVASIDNPEKTSNSQ